MAPPPVASASLADDHRSDEDLQESDGYALSEILLSVHKLILEHEPLTAAFILLRLSNLVETHGHMVSLTDWSDIVDDAAVETRLGSRCLAKVQMSLEKCQLTTACIGTLQRPALTDPSTSASASFPEGSAASHVPPGTDDPPGDEPAAAHAAPRHPYSNIIQATWFDAADREAQSGTSSSESYFNALQ
eukprot:TRINITY_DN44718_c0_g1_i9.p1 TRINITY_DN44718_c0_g1~~TRINITY_DN44718_c0_g1_i9.p1  ORF type:complete len:189 (-),score=39.20 TRINITY_DN44718_c0_g1_i9:436-1002(-)